MTFKRANSSRSFSSGVWMLTMLPRGELDRVDAKTIEAHYVEGAWKELFERKQS